MDLKNRKKKWKHRHLCQSFKHACVGIKTAWLDERNLRFHSLSAVLVICLAWLLQVTEFEWLWLLLCIALVFISELWNTVLENVVDLITDCKYNAYAKKAKDVASGAVFAAAIFAVVSGAVIFIPHIYTLFW
ncbi:diacylglycerol kinase family protein [Liquorilactobacillus oeni]|uniref:diacylglycerol kinase family protein n=1 Tax=Liquorilactobacillus oeni TaxID=303241 RepID=UPI00070E0062|nr:diacylglycerol kinase family protein [Liquorilactobacillus oeni]